MQLRQTLIMNSVNEPGRMNTFFFFSFFKAEQEEKA